MTDYEQGRSDERASLIGEIEKWLEENPTKQFVNRTALLSFLNSLKENK